MVKKVQSGGIFDPKSSTYKTPEQRGEHMQQNPGVQLSAVNFHMLFQIYKAACTNDVRYNEICKRYTKKVNK